MVENKNRCYFDKKGNWHECDRKEKECDGCEYEYVMAKTLYMLCHFCGKEIITNRIKSFCDEDCRNNWLRARAHPDTFTCGGIFWTEGFGSVPIQTEEEFKECHKVMGI